MPWLILLHSGTFWKFEIFKIQISVWWVIFRLHHNQLSKMEVLSPSFCPLWLNFYIFLRDLTLKKLLLTPACFRQLYFFELWLIFNLKFAHFERKSWQPWCKGWCLVGVLCYRGGKVRPSHLVFLFTLGTQPGTHRNGCVNLFYVFKSVRKVI